MRPPPGWQVKVDRLMAIYDRANIELSSSKGLRRVLAETKVKVAYRQLEKLMAMRPPARVISDSARDMFAALEQQVTVEAARQRATASSNDNASAQQQGKKQHG